MASANEFKLGYWRHNDGPHEGSTYWVAGTLDNQHEAMGPTIENAMGELINMLCRRIHVLETEIERFAPRR